MGRYTSKHTANIGLSSDSTIALRVFAGIIVLFSAAQLLGLYTGLFISNDIEGKEIMEKLGVISHSSELSNAFYLLFWVLLGAALIYLITRFYKGIALFKLIEFSIISSASSIVFYSFVKAFLIPHTLTAIAISIVLGLAFAAMKLLISDLRNVAAVVATAGAGAVFGFSLTFFTALIFLILLALYDYIAVFKTRHMVEMARSLSTKKLAFLVSSSQKTLKGEMRFELGTGDILMPIVLEVSGFQISPLLSAMVFGGSLVGLLVLFFLLFRRREVLPALPVLTFFIILFVGIGKLIALF